MSRDRNRYLPIPGPPGPGPIEIPGGEGPLYGGLRFPGHGYQQRPGEDRPALSAWARLARGGALGKSANLIFNAGRVGPQPSPVSILQIEGDDADAQQLVVTLGQPMVVPEAFTTGLEFNLQNLTTTKDNRQIQDQVNFPGLLTRIQWPPAVAVIEWGVGGSSNAAEVDFVNGATVAVVATYLRIKGAFDERLGSGVSGTSAAYTLFAQVGPGLARTRAQRTIYAGRIPSLTEGAVFSVPKFAKRAYVVGCDEAAAPNTAMTVATLRFWQSSDKTNNVGNFFIAGNQPFSCPIPNAAAYASVASGMATESLFSVVFELSI
jgi:hypothetical protein